MPVFRVEKNSNYTTMCNYHLRDQGLSLKGKGLLSMLLSLPDTWNYSVRGLSSITPDGVDGVLTALKELERLGYLERNQQRESNGRMGRAEYVIYEMPRKKPCSESPCTEKPYTVNPDTDTPVTENPAQLSTNRTSTETMWHTPGFTAGFWKCVRRCESAERTAGRALEKKNSRSLRRYLIYEVQGKKGVFRR